MHSLAYDDTARTLTLTTGSQGIMSVITTTYDTNGNTILTIGRTAGSAVGSRTVTTITATDKVCK